MSIPSTARGARVAAFLTLAPLGVAGCQFPGAPADAQADQQMSQALEAGPHMTLTPMRPATHAAFSFDPAKPTLPVFGPLSPIATRDAYDAVGGRFRPRLFGWMVHANVVEGDDAAVVWGTSHDGMAHGHGPET